MPFVSQIVKSLKKRKRRRKRRPEWQDVTPDSLGLKNLYDVAEKNVNRFARAFQSLASSIISDPKMLKEAEKAIRTGNVEGAVNALPFANIDDPEGMKDWDKFSGKMQSAYLDVMEESGKDALSEVGIREEFNIEKQEVQSLPPNPFSAKWIEEQAAKLVVDVSDSMKETIRQIILEGYKRGDRIETIMRRLKLSGRLGLLPREQKWVQNIEDKMREAGASQEKIERAVERKAKKFSSLRAERVARTEMITAQAQGRSDAWGQAADAGLIPPQVKRKWIAAGKSVRTCKICIGLNTDTAALGEPFHSEFVGSVMNPPAHPQCLPGDSAVTAKDVSATSKRWYEGDMVVVKTASGKKLTVTPNHPVLTDAGWLAPSDVDIGRHLLSCVPGDGITTIVDHDHKNVPSLIHEVCSSFQNSLMSSSVHVPTSAENFHGDVANGDIAIINSNSFLPDDIDTKVSQVLAQFSLVVRDACDSCLSGLRSFLFLGNSLLPSPAGLVGGGTELLPFVRAGFSHAQKHRLASPSGGNAGVNQDAADGGPRNPVELCKGLFGSSSDVFFDKVIGVDSFDFSGHVFNLQTESGIYIADQLVVHNCRCVIVLTGIPGAEGEDE